MPHEAVDPKKKVAEATKAPDVVPPIQGQTALATATPQAVAPPKTLRDFLEQAKPKLAEVLPRHLSADRLVRVTIACINKTPALLECTRDSILGAVMTAAQLGLEPTGVLGSAYLVPFNAKYRDEKGITRTRKEAQLIPGYRGLIDLARRSGQIESIEAHVVHANDTFKCRYGLDPVLEHEPCWNGLPGPVIAAYAVAKLKDGGKQIEVMTKSQLDAIKKATQSKGESGPWLDHEEEMDRKTVVRRICKYLPLSPEMADALAALDPEDRLDPEDVVPPSPKGVDGLKTILASSQTVELPAHDPVTGEVKDEPAEKDDGPTQAEIEEARDREAAEIMAGQPA